MHDKKQEKPEKIKSSNEDKIRELESLIAKTKYNKRTQSAIGLYKAQLAKLKEKQELRRSSGPKTEGYSVKKSGDATVILLGFPSVGKSTLLNAITNADSPVGSYEFTTLTVIPGLMEYNNAKIQVLDVPGIVKGAASGRGRGKEVLSVIQSADLVLMVIDIFHPEHLEVIKKEVYDSHIRINKRKPDVKITKTAKGGIQIGSTVKQSHMDNETMKIIMKEFKINNAMLLLRDDITPDELIDCIEGNKRYLPAIIAVNKIDMVDETQMKELLKGINPDILISADRKVNTENLKKLIFDRLEFIRVYTKEFGKKADMDEPMIMRRGSTLRIMCERLHKDFVTKFRFARIWGPSAKFDGQKVLNLNHEIKDGDIIEIRIR